MRFLARETWVIAAVISTAVIACAWSYGRVAAAADRADLAASDLRYCRSVTHDIRELVQRPSMAAAQELSSHEVASRVEASAKLAGIALDRLNRITPEPARRIPKTPFNEKLIRIDFRGVTLAQLISCIYPLTGNAPPLQVRDIHLTAAGEGNESELWNSEVVFGHVIYAPTQPGSE